jgi:TonB family protein
MNTDVKPPRLSRSQFPNEPRPDAGTGYFDIVVDEAGAVEIVKLISPEHRYHDRMLVAAAKAWKFEPALLNGRAVKYRVRIPIILQEIIR